MKSLPCPAKLENTTTVLLEDNTDLTFDPLQFAYRPNRTRCFKSSPSLHPPAPGLLWNLCQDSISGFRFHIQLHYRSCVTGYAVLDEWLTASSIPLQGYVCCLVGRWPSCDLVQSKKIQSQHSKNIEDAQHQMLPSHYAAFHFLGTVNTQALQWDQIIRGLFFWTLTPNRKPFEKNTLRQEVALHQGQNITPQEKFLLTAVGRIRLRPPLTQTLIWHLPAVWRKQCHSWL